MSHRIKLTFKEPSRVELANRSVFRLKVVASGAEGDNLDDAIFLHQQSLVDAANDVTCDEFISICSAFDLVTYPIDSPDSEQSPQFFRKDTMDILLPAVSVLEDTIASVKAQVGVLIGALDSLDDLSDSEDYWVSTD